MAENIGLIKHEIVYKNLLSVVKNYMPLQIKDLPVTHNMNKIARDHHDIITNINRAFWEMKWNEMEHIDVCWKTRVRRNMESCKTHSIWNTE